MEPAFIVFTGEGKCLPLVVCVYCLPAGTFPESFVNLDFFFRMNYIFLFRMS